MLVPLEIVTFFTFGKRLTIVAGMVAETMFVQPLNAVLSTLVTLSGMTIPLSPVHPAKALLPIEANVCGNVMLVSEVQFAKAFD